MYLERGAGVREKHRERNITWLPLAHAKPGAWPTAQALALTRNHTGVRWTVAKPPSPIRQGWGKVFKE